MTLVARGLTIRATLGGSQVDLLRDVDFAIAPGKVLGLVGESGAGKSMIGRVLARSLPQGFTLAGGSLSFRLARRDGVGHAGHAGQRSRQLLGDRIAFIPQEPLTALNPLLTIGDQFGEHLARLGVAKGERRLRIVEALADVKLPPTVLDRYPSSSRAA